MNKKEKPIYVLRRYTKVFSIDNFAFKRYMSVDGGVVKTVAFLKARKRLLEKHRQKSRQSMSAKLKNTV